MNNLLELVQHEKWNEALGLFLQIMRSSDMTEGECILGASIMEHFGEWDSMYDLIRLGLGRNPFNYELYILLGNYYADKNVNQAYLSYENALFFARRANETEDADYIIELIGAFLSENEVTVRTVSFIILSYNTLDYTGQCIESIRRTCPEGSYEIVVVDNASEDGSAQWLRQQEDVILVENTENVGFPKGCNQGIRAAKADNDIFLLNNDIVLMENSLYLLRMGLYENEKNGSAGAVTNFAGNNQIVFNEGNSLGDYKDFAYKNNVPARDAYEIKSMLIMFAMLIRRDVWDEVGELDERFSPGNYEDNDYGVRIMMSGHRNILCHNSFIFHYGSKSFNKDPDKYKQLMAVNSQKFKDKWGFSMSYYTHVRKEVANLINCQPDKPISVLEIGCGLGETLGYIKYRFANADVHGIEIEPEVAKIGARKFDIICGNIENMELANDSQYDYIIFADVLEHLVNPNKVLARMRAHLKDEGCILTSIPNIMNANVVYDLLHGSFTYQDAGILDRTHLRFFTKREILAMFAGEGYTVDHIAGIVSVTDSTKEHEEFFDGLLNLVGQELKQEFDIYQYLVRAKKDG